MSVKIGDIVNQYEIREKIGEGVLAEVFLAKHTFLDIPRAIKILYKDSPKITPDLFHEYCNRYKREWQLAARTRHPNFVRVYDLFEKDEALFAVVEYIPGGTLEEKLQIGGVQGEDWVIEVLRNCAKGLEHLHELETPQIIHCYVNPRTIVLDGKIAKITNFGKARSNIAKLHKEQIGQEDEYDRKYQAPEFLQLRKKLGPTTDVYSLGCVAFKMLTGIDVDVAKVHSPKKIEPSIPKWLDKIVVRCLCDDACYSKNDMDDPRKRYFDMTQLLLDLNKHAPTLSNTPASSKAYVSSKESRSSKVSDSSNMLLKQKMMSYFSIEELKNICHDLGENYERIGGKENIQSFVRHIVEYFDRNRKIDLLIKQLHMERPNVGLQREIISNPALGRLV